MLKNNKTWKTFAVVFPPTKRDVLRKHKRCVRVSLIKFNKTTIRELLALCLLLGILEKYAENELQLRPYLDGKVAQLCTRL